LIGPRLEEPDRARPLWARLAWLSFYWLVSIALLGVVAMILRWWLDVQ
jgi:hypothetical protein